MPSNSPTRTTPLMSGSSCPWAVHVLIPYTLFRINKPRGEVLALSSRFCLSDDVLSAAVFRIHPVAIISLAVLFFSCFLLFPVPSFFFCISLYCSHPVFLILSCSFFHYFRSICPSPHYHLLSLLSPSLLFLFPCSNSLFLSSLHPILSSFSTPLSSCSFSLAPSSYAFPPCSHALSPLLFPLSLSPSVALSCEQTFVQC